MTCAWVLPRNEHRRLGAAVDGGEEVGHRRQGAHPDADERDDHRDHRGQDDVPAPLVGHLPGQDAHEHHDDHAQGDLGVGHEGLAHRVAEGAHDQQQVEVDEDHQDLARPRGDELVAQGAHGLAVPAHPHDHGPVVLDPADEEGAQDDPGQGGQPAPLHGDDRAGDRSQGRDGFELVAEEHVAVGRREVDPVHVHAGRGGLLRVGLDDLAVDVAGVDEIAQHDGHRPENQDKN